MSKYWNREGRYQAEFDRMTETLMPAEGAAETLGGELVRAVNRVYYDAFNNGFLNNTSGAIRYIEKYLLPFYPNSQELVQAVNLVEPKTNTGGYSNLPATTEMALDTLVDYVADFVLTHEAVALTPNPADLFSLQEEDYFDYEDEEDYWDGDDYWDEEEEEEEY